VAIVGSSAHHRDDLLDGRRVGGIELPLVAGRATGVVAGHRRGRSPPAGGIEHSRDSHGISSQTHSGQSPSLYQRLRVDGNQHGVALSPLASPQRCASPTPLAQVPGARPLRHSATPQRRHLLRPERRCPASARRPVGPTSACPDGRLTANQSRSSAPRSVEMTRTPAAAANLEAGWEALERGDW
jgi:hypothetical protein